MQSDRKEHREIVPLEVHARLLLLADTIAATGGKSPAGAVEPLALTLLDYVTQRRVSCARRLMITTDEKILDIAQESGFGSLGQFYACLKRITGQSPARYRRALRR